MLGFRTHSDVMGTPSVVLTPSDTRFAVLLVAGVSKTVTVPADARTVLFSATGPFWVQYGSAAALPVADMTAGNVPELSPSVRWIDGISRIDLVAPANCAVSLSFYG